MLYNRYQPAIAFPKKALKYILIYVLVIVILLTAALSYKYYVENDIRKNAVLTTATIIAYDYGAKNTSTWKYCFDENGNKDTVSTDAPAIRHGYGNRFVGKAFPFIYSSKNIKHAMVLIFPGDFKKFNLAMPDSLKWVIRYQDE